MVMIDHKKLVERVARAIAVANDDRDRGVVVWVPYQDDARAAISTIAEALRENSEAMIKESQRIIDYVDNGSGFPPSPLYCFHKITAKSPLYGD